MAYPVMPLGFLGSQGDQDTYRIERSLRFNSADSAYLSRTYGSGTSATTWTISCWVKRSSFGAATCIFSERLSSNANVVTQLDFQSSDTLRLVGTNTSGSVTLDLITTQVFRDPSAWFHLVVAADSTQATASERFKIYINGSQVTSLGTATYPAQNSTFGVFSASEHNIGRRFLAVSGTDALFNGYITEFHAIDGQALTPSSFGETDAITGRWKAKAYSGTYGTNGFYLKFADNSGTTATTLGKDSSGNGNNWTPNNFSVTAGAGNDSLLDSPTNNGTSGNYATWNALDSTASSISNGNLDLSTPSSGWGTTRATIGVNSGKWYWEITYISGATGYIGIIDQADPITNYIGQSSTSYGYYANGQKWNSGAGSSYGSSYTSNDIIGVALDLDSGSIVFYKNGTSQGTAYSSIPLTRTYFPSVCDGSNSAGDSFTANFGQRPFAYTAPSGFKALCTTNLPTPTIQKPSKYMDVVTYTGNGSTQTISGLGFSPDFLWSKSRSVGRSHRLIDSVRGIDNVLVSDTTAAEYTGSAISSFNSNGFSLKNADNYNVNSETYVAWAWDEAPIAGMDIVAYTGNGTNRTIAHNLGVAPKMMIVKNRLYAGAWRVYHQSIGNTKNLRLNLTNAEAVDSTIWNNTSPTSSDFAIGTDADVNRNNDTHIAHLFAEVEGFSKFGSYTGNGSADGPFVWCGFRPRWVMVKSVGEAGGWTIMDSSRLGYNAANSTLYAEATTVEQGYLPIDILSNGFKIRITSTGTSFNTNGNGYIFAAFAESPFKYSRAR